MFFYAFLNSRNIPRVWITLSKHGKPLGISLRELFLLIVCFSVTKALEKLKTIEGQITDKDLQDNKEGIDFLSNISEASAYQMREGSMLSTQNANEREPSAASQIYNELKRSYTSLVGNVAPSAEEADQEYHKVKYKGSNQDIHCSCCSDLFLLLI